jgi:hypothetical protein
MSKKRKIPDTLAVLRRRVRDLELAVERIGTTTEARCRWLLEEFVPRDPTSLASGEVTTLRDNLQALAWHGAGARPPNVGASGWYNTDDPVLVDDGALRQVWERVCALTRAHQAGVMLPLGEELLRRAPTTSPGSYLRLERHRVIEGLADRVVFNSARLLEACDRLRVCPECDRIFVARRRQLRHGTCARQARDRRRPSRQKKGA